MGENQKTRGKLAGIGNGEVEALLESIRPSQLDAEVTRVCPLYRERDGGVSSVYSSLHEIARSALLSRLALRLRDLEIRGEEDCGSGRTDGSVNGATVDGGSVLGPRGEMIAIIEVKTGQVKLLQSACYSCMRGAPVLVAEFETGYVHLLRPEVAERLLRHAAEQARIFGELEREGVRIPDRFRCACCSNTDCPHCRGDGVPDPPALGEKVEKLLDNLPAIVGRCVEEIGKLLEERGYTIQRREGTQPQEV
jgi:hypothetical protein